MNYQPAIQLIRKSNKIGIAVYEKGGGDEIGSALALASILKKQEKNVDYLFSGKIEKKWADLFMAKTDVSESKKNASADQKEVTPSKTSGLVIAINTRESPVGEIKYEAKKDELFIILSPQKTSIKKENIKILDNLPDYDCLISLGVESPECFGKEFEENPLLFYEKPIINIDVSSKNENFGEINLVDMTKSSIAEIVFELFDNLTEDELGALEATRLLTGIIEKTDNFKNHKTTPDVLETASYLMETGADKDLIIKTLYKTKPLKLLQLWGRALVRSRFDDKTGALWTFLPKSDFEKTETTTQDIVFVMNHMKEYFESPKFHTFLFENPRKDHVRAIVKSNNQRLSAIALKEPSEEKDGFLLLKKDFTGFPEAESYVDKLLRGLEE